VLRNDYKRSHFAYNKVKGCTTPAISTAHITKHVRDVVEGYGMYLGTLSRPVYLTSLGNECPRSVSRLSLDFRRLMEAFNLLISKPHVLAFICCKPKI